MREERGPSEEEEVLILHRDQCQHSNVASQNNATNINSHRLNAIPCKQIVAGNSFGLEEASREHDCKQNGC